MPFKPPTHATSRKGKAVAGHRGWQLSREARARDVKLQAVMPQRALKLAKELSQEGVSWRERKLGQDRAGHPMFRTGPATKEMQ